MTKLIFRRFLLTVLLTMLTWLVIINTKLTTKSIDVYRNANDFSQTYKESFLKSIQRERYNVDCELILEGNKNEIERAERLRNDTISQITPMNETGYIFDMDKCSLYRQLRGYDDYIVKKSELEFPLAFSILVYENVEQFERLFRLIYRPHNIYCIHIDANSNKLIQDAIKSIVKCFDNVFTATKPENVVYAGYTLLKAYISCKKDLWNMSYLNTYPYKLPVKWKYLLNMAATELPLRTNYELTRILRLFNGGNDIEVLNYTHPSRHLFKYREVKINNVIHVVNTRIRKEPPPHNFTIQKGSAYGSFSYDFVGYILNNPYARDLLNWFNDTLISDEAFWPTLQHNTQFNPPGGYEAHQNKTTRLFSRWIIWIKEFYHCYGYWRHGICIFSMRDLVHVVSRPEFIANKFKLNYNPIGFQCMEEWYLKRALQNVSIKTSDYCRHVVIQKYNKDAYCDPLFLNESQQF